MKKLYIKKGTKTSFQYHNYKVETNFLIAGSVEAWFEDKKRHIDIKTLGPGSIWTIPAGVRHRIVTLQDIIAYKEFFAQEIDNIEDFITDKYASSSDEDSSDEDEYTDDESEDELPEYESEYEDSEDETSDDESEGEDSEDEFEDEFEDE